MVQVDIEVSRHQQIQLLGDLLECCDNTLYCWHVIGGEITSDDVTSLLPHHQVEADNIPPKLLDGIHRISQWRLAEHCDSAVVSARRVCSNSAVTGLPVGVESAHQIGILKD